MNAASSKLRCVGFIRGSDHGTPLFIPNIKAE